MDNVVLSKFCSRGKHWGLLVEFGKGNNADGHHCWCNKCRSEYANQRNQIPEVKRAKAKCNRKRNQLPWVKKATNERQARRSLLPAVRKARSDYDKKRHQMPEVKKAINKRDATRRATDILFKLAKNLRGRLRYAFQSNCKSGSAVTDLGCPIDFAKHHLESQFYPHPVTGEMMTWKSWGSGVGKWQVDHINPVCNFDLSNREEFLKACHYTNLQPLWFEDHLRKTAAENRTRKRKKICKQI